MTEIIGVVEQGRIKLPEAVHLTEGQTVRVLWEEASPLSPLEREEWTEEEMKHELAWATGKQFPKGDSRELAGNANRPRESDPAYLLTLPKAERNRIMEAQCAEAAPLYEADLALPVEQRELTAFL